jgi:branched-chain amino acid transport system ATP-binding protein
MSAPPAPEPEAEVLLRLDQVTTYYAQMRILEGISLQVGAGELVCLLGGNASGKSTTLKTILGIVRPRSGRVLLGGQDVTQWPVPQRIAAGMAIVPENRRLFGQLTVRENLELGAVLRKGESLSDDFDQVHELFPRLLERRSQLAGTLSGGEQQMVAMGRALMSRPRLLLMDEPSMGLSPALVQQNFQIIKTIHASGVAVLMVEQNATMALSIADRGYVLSTGEIVLEGPAGELLRHEDLKRAYLGRLAPLPGQRVRCSPGQDGQVVAGGIAVQRAGAVGQHLGHHRHASHRDRAGLEQAAGQFGEQRRALVDPRRAKRDAQRAGRAERRTRGHRQRRLPGRDQHPPQARGQVTAELRGRQPRGPGRQAGAFLRARALGQRVVEPRGRGVGQEPLPGPPPPQGQAALIIVQQDMHRVSPPVYRDL